MNDADRKIIIINGVMGVIGSNIFSHFAQQDRYIIYGISRKGLYFQKFINTVDGKLPENNLVFSLIDYKKENYEIDISSFVDSLQDLPIVFIHTMGKYVTEISRDGEIKIENDTDNDGINDEVKRLTYDVPLSFCKKLSQLKSSVTFIQIGSLSDKYKMKIHGSWVKSMDLLKDDLKNICARCSNFNTLILNVSSVLTPKELIDRPFLSIKTNAEMSYWLPPSEIAKFIDEYSQLGKIGFDERELYRKWPNISPDHFSLQSYTTRRGRELYGDEYKEMSSDNLFNL